MQTVMRKAYQGRIVKSSAAAEAAAPQAAVAAELAEAAADVERIRAEAEAQADQVTRAAAANAEAAIAERVMTVTRQMQGEIDAVQPVLIDLVLDCVRKIVGEMPPHRQVSGLVRAGLAELKAEKGVVLMAPLEDYPALKDAVRDLQGAAQEPIRTIRIDSDLPTGRCRLVNGSVALEIGLENQLKALEAMLRPVQPDAAADLSA